MSLPHPPFPINGIDDCPSQDVANRIIRCAYVIDGENAISAIADRVDLKHVGEHKVPYLKPKSRISELRRPIAELWDTMSIKARTLFLLGQYAAAVDYLHDCLENVRTELGDIDVEVILPTTDQVFARFAPDLPSFTSVSNHED